jgi:hypothetical protein
MNGEGTVPQIPIGGGIGVKFEPDFFNNVAAIAVVLVFTKIVVHRSKKTNAQGWSRLLAVLHVVAVVSAAVALSFSLRATDIAIETDRGWRTIVWSGIGLAGAILLVDIVAKEAFEWRERPKAPCVKSSAQAPAETRPNKPETI